MKNDIIGKKTLKKLKNTEKKLLKELIKSDLPEKERIIKEKEGVIDVLVIISLILFASTSILLVDKFLIRFI